MLDSNKIHHAYLIEGRINPLLHAVKTELEKKYKFKMFANPDVIEKIYESFGIDNAREINSMLLDRPLGDYKIFLLGIPSMTNQAGNALLKSLEEPPASNYLFIFTPNSKRMLPTLLSRVVLISKEETSEEIAKLKKSPNEEGDEEIIEISGEEFLKMNQTKRFDEVKKIMGSYDKEKISKSDVIVFMTDIIEEYRRDEKRDDAVLKNALAAYDYAPDQSSSLKILLEYLALIL